MNKTAHEVQTRCIGGQFGGSSAYYPVAYGLGVRFFASGAFGPARRSPNRSTDFSDEAVGLPNSVDFVVVQATRSNGITDDKRRAERIVDVLWEYDRSTS